MQLNTSQKQKLLARRPLPDDEALRALLSDISLRIIAMGAGEFIHNFAQAAGQAIGADMLLVSRIKSKAVPVETYALYDRKGEATSFIYPIAGTPCEVVFDQVSSLTVNEEVASCFPHDKDLKELCLHSYVGTPLVDESGRPVGLIAALWGRARPDLRLEVQALEYFSPLIAVNMLQLEAGARHELAVSGASSGVWYMDFEAGLEYFSTSARRIVGRSEMTPCAKLGAGLEKLAPEDQRIVRAAFDAYRRGDTPFDVSFHLQPSRGPARWLRMTGKAAHNADGRMTALAGDIVDISDLVKARRAAEDASRAKSAFLATMSHEIRTAMNGVLGMTGLLAEADLPPEQKRQAAVIKKSGEAMMLLLNDVLDMSKIEAGKLELEERDFSPRDLIEEVAMLWRGPIEKKGLDFAVHIAETVPEYIRGDETRLRQILTNFLSNALKFTADGAITLKLEAEPSKTGWRLTFAISDTGIGINAAQQKRLFSAFGQANSSITRRFGGTGLGLAISERIVRLMGGRIQVNSRPGQGATFSFAIDAAVAEKGAQAQGDAAGLTRTTAPAMMAEPDPASEKVPEKAAKTGTQKTVLIAEDNEINRAVLQALLGRLPLKLNFVENGAQAVELAEAHHFDVILMDVQMPVLNGICATEDIRTGSGPCRLAPIIALTANAMSGDRQRYLEAGMTGYVSKPIDPRKLFAALKEAKPLPADFHPGSARSA